MTCVLLSAAAEAGWGNTSFWAFCATTAFIAQLVLQQYYARRAAKERKEVAEKISTVARKTEVAATTAAAVKTALKVSSVATEAKLNEIRATGDKVHSLVNNAMLQVLHSNAVLARKVAELTGAPEDQSAADAAEAAYTAHQDKQKRMDESEHRGDKP